MRNMNIRDLYVSLDYVEVEYKMHEESCLIKSVSSRVRDANVEICGIIECGNRSYNHNFDISLEICRAIAEKKKVVGEMACTGKLDDKYKRSTGQSCDCRIEYEITPYFKEDL